MNDRAHDDPVLQGLGRVEGKLDAFTAQLASTGQDVDELRREQAKTNAQVTAHATTLRIFGWLIGAVVMPGLAAVTAIVIAYHHGAGR
jgi:hypothetical protein